MLLQHRHNNAALTVVGTLMKPTREAELCKQGLLHMAPIDDVMYVPLDVYAPLVRQAAVNVILVKATDWLEADDGTMRFGNSLTVVRTLFAELVVSKSVAVPRAC